MKNSGRKYQDDFEGYFKIGKDRYCERIQDSQELYGRNKGVVQTRKQPADFYTVHPGDRQLSFTEVKSTQNRSGFSKSQIESEQMKTAIQVTKSGGLYYFALYSIHLKKRFLVPARFVLNYTKSKTIPWNILTDFIWRNDEQFP